MSVTASASERTSNRSRKLKKLKNANGGIYVTDHALLRYMQRVMGIDVEKLRSDMVTDSMKTLFTRMGNGKFPLGGNTYIVEDGLVVTVLTKEGQER